MSGNIKIQAHLDDRTLKISIKDTGIPYNPTQKTPQTDLDRPLEERSMGGLGVYLVLQSVDELLYERTSNCDRNIIIVRREIPASSPQQSPIQPQIALQ